jgi:excisionase family DNA binding protein
MVESNSRLLPLLTIKDAGKILGASTKTLRRRIEAGELPVVRDGRLVRILPADLEKYIASRRSL